MVQLFDEVETAGEDAFFKNKVSRQAFRMAIKFGGASFTDTSLSALIRSDATTTDPIDEIDTYLVKLQDAGLSEQDFALEPTSGPWARAELENHGETKPLESARRLKQLRLVSRINLLIDCYRNFYRNGLEGFGIHSQELTMKSSRTIEDWMYDVSREHTICFQVSDNGQYYIQLRSLSFSDSYLWLARKSPRLLHSTYEMIRNNFSKFLRSIAFRTCLWERWKWWEEKRWRQSTTAGKLRLLIQRFCLRWF